MICPIPPPPPAAAVGTCVRVAAARHERGLAALLCAVGTAHALGETCSTLWSKLTHLGCRPQDLQLRDRLVTLTLSDGGVVNLRCTEDHAFCFRAGHTAGLSQPSSLPLTAEPFPSVTHTAATSATGRTAAAAAFVWAGTASARSADGCFLQAVTRLPNARNLVNCGKLYGGPRVPYRYHTYGRPSWSKRVAITGRFIDGSTVGILGQRPGRDWWPRFRRSVAWWL